MKKRNLSISMLFFACIFMLMQSFIPHHHHDESQLCIEKKHCEDAVILSSSFSHHTHEGDSSEDHCNYDQYIIIASKIGSKVNKNNLNFKVFLKNWIYQPINDYFVYKFLNVQGAHALMRLKPLHEQFLYFKSILRGPPLS